MLEICMLIFGTEVSKSSAIWLWFIHTMPSLAYNETEALPSTVL
jgi:hypothetical protein